MTATVSASPATGAKAPATESQGPQASGGSGGSLLRDSTAKAATLIEALPWLDRFHGRTVVIKYGGHAMTGDALRAGFAQDVVFLRYAGLRPVVVHGGGPQISAHLARLGVPSAFTAGLRVTTPETMDVVRMVLTGQVNRDVVGLINRHGPFAVGMSGEDANMFTARRRHAVVDGTPVDIGLVGEIESVDPAAVHALISDGRIPVVSSVARGTGGEVYNVNADTAAAALAVALGAKKLVFLTGAPGILERPEDPGSLVSYTDLAGLARLREQGSLAGGMLPKAGAVEAAIAGGVPRVHILSRDLPGGLLAELFTNDGVGTLVVATAGAPAPATVSEPALATAS
jgi:acetylglutamate kinase